jgi:uncharacterized damage-inducible protein DinB
MADDSVLKEQFLETWRINHRLNLFLLDAVDDEVLNSAIAKGKTVASHFCHIHNVRLMWIKVVSPALMEGLEKLEKVTDRAEIVASLEKSAAAMEQLLAEGWDAGRVKSFKPHPMAFLGYLISHETHHRAQAELGLRQLGKPVSDKVAYGLWEWGVR